MVLGAVVILIAALTRVFIINDDNPLFLFIKICVTGIIEAFGGGLLISVIIHDGNVLERIITAIRQIYRLTGKLIAVSVITYVLIGVLIVMLPLYVFSQVYILYEGLLSVIIALVWLGMFAGIGLWFPWILQSIVREEVGVWSAVTRGYWIVKHNFKIAVLLMTIVLIMEGGVELLWRNVITNSYTPNASIFVGVFMGVFYLIIAGGKEAFTWLLYVHAWSFLQD